MTLVAKMLGGELALYFVVKALRRDLWYWFPLDGVSVSGGVVSFIARVIAKTIGDWAAVFQTRHPQEVGGVYFVISLLVSVVIGIVAAIRYKNVDTGEEETVTKDTVIKMMATCCIGMIVSFVTLLCSMKKAYIHAFLRTKTGNKFTQEHFTNAEDDESKFFIFTTNKQKMAEGDWG